MYICSLPLHERHSFIRPVDKLHAEAPTRPSPSKVAPQEGHVLQPITHVHILRTGPRTAVRMILTNAKGVYLALSSLCTKQMDI